MLSIDAKGIPTMSLRFINFAQHPCVLFSRALASMLSEAGVAGATESITICELSRRGKRDYLVVVPPDLQAEVNAVLARFTSCASNETGAWVFRATDSERLLAGWYTRMFELEAA
jgi:hypothetical protein